MDAVKFIEEHRRMYKVTGKHLPTLAEGIPAEDVVKEVEEWAAAHPRKTRKSVFLDAGGGVMERLTEKHYLGTDHYMKCSGNCNVDMDCIDCPSFDCLVERLAAYEDTWLEPEEITAMQQTLDEYHKVADPLLRAQADGRLVVLPFTRGRTLLCEENIDSPRLMKDVDLAIRYCSSCGIVFHMGYNVFCDLVKHGRITAVSEEAEKALEAMNNG